MNIAGTWTEIFETVVVVGATFGLIRRTECEHPGCHRFVVHGQRYCKKHLGRITR